MLFFVIYFILGGVASIYFAVQTGEKSRLAGGAGNLIIAAYAASGFNSAFLQAALLAYGVALILGFRESKAAAGRGAA